MRDMSDPPPPQPPLPATPASSLLCSSVVHRSSEPINELDSDDDDVDEVIQVDPPPDAVPTSVTSPAPSSPSALPPPPPPPSKLHIPSRIHHQLCGSTPPSPSTPHSPTPTMEDLGVLLVDSPPTTPPPPPSFGRPPMRDVSQVPATPDSELQRSFADVVRSPLVRPAASFLSTDDPLQPPTKPRLKSTIFVPARSSYFTTRTMPPRRSSPHRYRYSQCALPLHPALSALWIQDGHASSVQAEQFDTTASSRGGRASAPTQQAFRSKTNGRCFVCLAPDHWAALCREPVRCFRCLRSGHRVRDCKVPDRCRSGVDQAPLHGWRDDRDHDHNRQHKEGQRGQDVSTNADSNEVCRDRERSPHRWVRDGRFGSMEDNQAQQSSLPSQHEVLL